MPSDSVRHGVFIHNPLSVALFVHDAVMPLFDNHTHGHNGAMVAVLPKALPVEYLNFFVPKSRPLWPAHTLAAWHFLKFIFKNSFLIFTSKHCSLRHERFCTHYLGKRPSSIMYTNQKRTICNKKFHCS